MGSTDVSNRMEDEWLPSCGIDYDSFAQHWYASPPPSSLFRLASLADKNVVRIAAGASHSLAVTEDSQGNGNILVLLRLSMSYSVHMGFPSGWQTGARRED